MNRQIIKNQTGPSLNTGGTVYIQENEQMPWRLYFDFKNYTGAEMFVWQRSLFELFKCVTIPYKGISMKINHKMNRYISDSIYLHDSGFLFGQNALKISSVFLQDTNILQLSVKQFQQIEDDGLCSNLINFDFCRDRHIQDRMNATFGCVLYLR